MSGIKIPAHWTADEALTVAYFLENIIKAIWDTHGQMMSLNLQVVYDRALSQHREMSSKTTTTLVRKSLSK